MNTSLQINMTIDILKKISSVIKQRNSIVFMCYILFQKPIIIMLNHYSTLKKLTDKYWNILLIIKEVGLVSDEVKTGFLTIYVNFYHWSTSTFHFNQLLRMSQFILIN